MAYKIPRKYHEAKEIQRIRRKYKGKLPPFKVISRTGTRTVFGIPTKLHKAGTIIEYKGKTAVITKVTKKGVYIMPFKTNGFIKPAREKPLFVPEEKYVQTKNMYPVIPLVAI